MGIDDPIVCKDAASKLAGTHGIRTDYKFIDEIDYKGPGRPQGCSYHRFGNVQQWHHGHDEECTVNGFAGCFRKVVPDDENCVKWNDIENMNYKYSMIPGGAGSSNDNFVFLGKVKSLDECKQNAMNDEKNVYQNVVWVTPMFGEADNEWQRTCYGNIDGAENNPVAQKKYYDFCCCGKLRVSQETNGWISIIECKLSLNFCFYLCV